MARFDDRFRPRNKDGDDFQNFVWDALNCGHFDDLLGTRYNRLYTAAGNDGGIDHLVLDNTDQIVVQCKFHGKDRRDEPSSDWNDYSKRLGQNLRKNALRPKNQIARLYKPWFDVDCPVKGYIFCSSGNFTPGAQSELEQTIRGFFADLVQEFAPLRHLAGIKVWVLGWNDFEGALKAKPSLAFSWFQLQQSGFKPLRSISSGKTFRKFLQAGDLPFFSRNEFNRIQDDGESYRIADERSILSRLLEDVEKLGLVLSGPGGVGKTRLALELGLEAEEDDWLVLQVERYATPEDIERLAQLHTSPAKVLFVIDYAEAARSLSELTQKMAYANRVGGHRIRFIATCRASALGAVKEAIEDHNFEVIEFSGASARPYENWVVAKILASADLPNAKSIGAVCNGLPVLAAFAVYLYKEHHADFMAQFGHIHKDDDFSNWADKRLRLAIKSQGLDNLSMRKRLAEIGAALPLSKDEYAELYRSSFETQRLCDLLLADRWIERDDNGVAAAHDIFADAILVRYLFEINAAATDRTADLLYNAAKIGTFDRAFIALNRLATHPNFNDVDGLAAILSAHRGNPSAVIAASDLLLKARLPDERAAIRALEALPDVASEVTKHARCDGLISILAEATADSKDSDWHEEAAAILRPLLDRAVQRTHNSNIVVRRALRLLPERYRDRALEWIKKEPTRSETHFLFVAWLRCGLPVEDIISDIDFWLCNGGVTDPKASFVFSAWLNRAAELSGRDCADQIAKISEHLTTWLKIHALNPDTRFVYLSWLRAVGELDKRDRAAALSEIIGPWTQWLKANAINVNTRHFYEISLEAIIHLDRNNCAAQAKIIEPTLKIWLETNVHDENARFLFDDWLKLAAKLHKKDTLACMVAIEAPLRAWLELHGSEDFARFVYQPWLDAAANLERSDCFGRMLLVEASLLKWLEFHRVDENARFVYQPWIDAAAKLHRRDCLAHVAKVEQTVVAWLAHNAESEDADRVYKPWLNAAAKLSSRDCAGQISKISAHLRKWLKAHGRIDSADFLYKAWLAAAAQSGKQECASLINDVEPYLSDWVRHNGSNPNAGHVYGPFLNAVAKLERRDCVFQIARISTPLFKWLNANQAKSDESFVLSAWLNAVARLDRQECALQIAKIEASLFPWLDMNWENADACFILAAWLSASAKLDRDGCARQTAKIEPFVLGWLDTNGKREDANFLYRAWLKAVARLDHRECAAKIANAEKPLLGWLNLHGSGGSASYIYQAWIDSAANLNVNECIALLKKIEPFLINWINENGSASGAGFVYAPWLNAAAKLDPRSCEAQIHTVSDRIAEWLNTHGAERNAGFVYEGWLNAVARLDKRERDGQIAIVSSPLARWFRENGTKPGAQKVASAWARAGGLPEAINYTSPALRRPHN